VNKEELYDAWFVMNNLQLNSHPLVTHEIRERAKTAWAKLQNMHMDEQNELTIECRKQIALLEKTEKALERLE
jgi:hypothetical protein